MTRSLGATPSIVSMVRLGLRSSSRVAVVMGRYCPTSADRSWGRCPARWRDALSPLAAPSRCLDPLSVFAVDDSAPATGPACSASPRCRVWTSASASAAPRSRRGSPGAVPGSVSRVLSGRCHAARVRSARDRSGPRLEDLFSWTLGPVPLLCGVGLARPVQSACVLRYCGAAMGGPSSSPSVSGCLSCSSCFFPSSPLSPLVASPTSASRGASLPGEGRLPVVDLFRGRRTLPPGMTPWVSTSFSRPGAGAWSIRRF